MPSIVTAEKDNLPALPASGNGFETRALLRESLLDVFGMKRPQPSVPDDTRIALRERPEPICIRELGQGEPYPKSVRADMIRAPR